MRINFYATLRLVTGEKTIALDLAENMTVRQLLERLVKQYPQLRPEFFDDQERLFAAFPIFVNGRNPRLTEAGLNLQLKPEDVISLFAPIASGRMNVEVLREPAFDRQE